MEKSNKKLEIPKVIAKERSYVEQEIEHLKRRKDYTFRISMTLLLMLITLLAFLIASKSLFIKYFGASFELISGLISIISIYAAILIVLFYYRYRTISSRLEERVEKAEIRERLAAIDPKTLGKQSSASRDDGEEYFNSLVAINVENLSTYYIQVKDHANKSFVASMMMSILGFVLICIAIALSLVSNNSISAMSYVAAGSGILVEFISAIFFYLYSKTVTQMKHYHDSLLSVQNTLLSFRLVESITDEQKRYDAITKIIGYLLNKNSMP